MCHLGIEPIAPGSLVHKQQHDQQQKHQQPHEVLEFLSNLTPGSLKYNETVQNLHRSKRCLNCGHTKNFHRRIGHHVLQQTMYHQGHFNRTDWHHNMPKHNSSSSAASHPGSEASQQYFNCHGVSSYAWLLIFIYITFALCVLHFLDVSESAVFTVAIVTASLPLVELFWSTFRLSVEKGTGESFSIFLYCFWRFTSKKHI